VYNAIDGVRNFLLSAAPEHHRPPARAGKILAENIPSQGNKNK
jgi:hypothetical protein